MTQKWLGQTDPKVTPKWPKSDSGPYFWVTFGSLGCSPGWDPGSHFWVTLGSFCVSVELGGRPLLHNSLAISKQCGFTGDAAKLADRNRRLWICWALREGPRGEPSATSIIVLVALSLSLSLFLSTILSLYIYIYICLRVLNWTPGTSFQESLIEPQLL